MKKKFVWLTDPFFCSLGWPFPFLLVIKWYKRVAPWGLSGPPPPPATAGINWPRHSHSRLSLMWRWKKERVAGEPRKLSKKTRLKYLSVLPSWPLYTKKLERWFKKKGMMKGGAINTYTFFSLFPLLFFSRGKATKAVINYHPVKSINFLLFFLPFFSLQQQQIIVQQHGPFLPQQKPLLLLWRLSFLSATPQLFSSLSCEKFVLSPPKMGVKKGALYFVCACGLWHERKKTWPDEEKQYQSLGSWSKK